MMNSFDPQNQALYLLGLVQWNSWDTTKIASGDGVLSLEAVRQVQAGTLELLNQLRIECQRTGDIVAWYKVIERSEFEGQDATANLADLNWITPRVLAHEAVVSKLCEYFVTYPARFGCLFSTKERLVTFVQQHTSELNRFFNVVGHKQEWGIKLVANVDQASEQLAKRALGSQHGTGNHYLKLKQLTRQLRPQALKELITRSQVLLGQLQRHFPQQVVRGLTRGSSPDRQHVLANIALLLDVDEVESMQAWCQQHTSGEDEALCVEAKITGPWPPYSFCPSLVDEPRQNAA